MTIRAVVFDLGGVLETNIDTDTHAKWEKRLNLKPGELRERYFSTSWLIDATFGKFTEEEMLRKLGEIYSMNPAQVDEFMQDFWDRYCGQLNSELATYFKSLRPRYQTAILSNGVPGARTIEQGRFHFAEMTDLIIYSCEEKTAKPERRIFEITCERLGRKPEEIIFLDDVKTNVAAAREFGIHAVLFQDTAQAIADVQTCLQASNS
jgi:epoxide hydrolase-like predicted phosphatase